MQPEQSATLPTASEMATKSFTVKNWLQYYKNSFTRSAVASSVDIRTDTYLKAKTPDEIVQGDDGRPMTVKERLEARKLTLIDKLAILKAIEELSAIADEEWNESQWSDKALAVAEDMIPAEPKEGDSCVVGGKEGLLENRDGQLICVPTAVPAEDNVEDRGAVDESQAPAEENAPSEEAQA